MQHFLKALAGTAGAGIVASEFLKEFLVSVDDPVAAHDARLGWESFAAFTHLLERIRRRCCA